MLFFICEDKLLHFLIGVVLGAVVDKEEAEMVVVLGKKRAKGLFAPEGIVMRDKDDGKRVEFRNGVFFFRMDSGLDFCSFGTG